MAVCVKHGGRAPQVVAAAAERTLDAKVRRVLARVDVEQVTDPVAELARLAGQVLAFRDELAARVNELGAVRYSATPGAGTEQLRSEVALYERALDRAAKVLTAMAQLQINNRLTVVSERQAEMVVRAVDAGLAAAGVVGPAALEARQVVARELRAVQ